MDRVQWTYWAKSCDMILRMSIDFLSSLILCIKNSQFAEPNSKAKSSPMSSTRGIIFLRRSPGQEMSCPVFKLGVRHWQVNEPRIFSVLASAADLSMVLTAN